MLRLLLAPLLLCGVLAFGSGCFVIDELDSGLAEMKGASPGGKKAQQEAEQASAASAKAGAKEEGFKPPDLAAWWKSARTPSSGPKDPSTATEVVSCRIGGSVRFMSKTDCQVQGGRF